MSTLETPIEQLHTFVRTLTSADIDMHSTAPQPLIAPTKARAAWDELYKGYSMENFRTRNVIERDDHILVKINHPASDLIEHNGEILSCGMVLKGCMIFPKDDSRLFYKVSKKSLQGVLPHIGEQGVPRI